MQLTLWCQNLASGYCSEEGKMVDELKAISLKHAQNILFLVP